MARVKVKVSLTPVFYHLLIPNSNPNPNPRFDPLAFKGKGGVRPSFQEWDIRDVSMLPGVAGVMSIGSVLAVELKAAQSGSKGYYSNDSAVVVSLLKVRVRVRVRVTYPNLT
jgi:hypothetical protein